MYVEEYLPHIGQEGVRLPQNVSAEAIRRFAEAVGETDPIYLDEDYAKTTPYGRIIAPPTFCFTLRYPPIPDIWIAPAGRIHAMQSFSYNRSLFAGESVMCGQRLSNAYEKEGRNGVMVFLEQERTVYDQAGEVICSNRMTTITRGSLFEARNAAASAGESALRQQPAQAVSTPIFTQGQSLPAITLPPVTRMDIVKYAGAVWDHNAIHLQDEAAQEVGFPSVIAHGMLSAALQGRVAQKWTGGGYSFTGMQMRLNKPVFPGDELTFSGTVTQVQGPEVEIAFKVSSQRKEQVLSGGVVMKQLE